MSLESEKGFGGNKYIRAFPFLDGEWTVWRYINRETGEDVGKMAVKEIDPEIQKRIDEVCREGDEDGVSGLLSRIEEWLSRP
jgi:hypothetical protein